MLILFFIFFISKIFYSQTILADGFKDGNFNQNPSWKGDTLDFIILEEEGYHLLRLNSSASEVFSLITAQHGTTGIWDLYVRLDFPPSTSNAYDHI